MSPFTSYSQLYREAVNRLNEAGIANARYEALWILEQAIGLNRLQLHTHPDISVDPEGCQRAVSLIDRRVSQEPLQYVLGTQEFFGLELFVKPGVLIPRPETELLVHETIALLKDETEPIILDVGTGSGCIAISVAVALKKARVISIDRSLQALSIARLNALRHGTQARIQWLAGDLLTPLLSQGLAGKVTAIIANLPYISHAEWENLSPDVKDFEPRLALDGGEDGLEVYRRLLNQAPGILSPRGFVIMEIGMGQAEPLCQDPSVENFFQVLKIQPDFQGIARMVSLQRVGA